MRPRPILTRLLVLALLFQWGTAFAHCLRFAGAGPDVVVEICTPDGLHRMALPAEEGEAPRQASHAMPCPACLGPAGPALLPPEVALARPILLAQAADPPPPPAPPQLPPRSCQPRAPPTS